jgi:hypothetical protein
MLKQTAGRSDPDCWIRVMEPFLDEGQDGKRQLSQSFGRKQARLGLLVL